MEKEATKKVILKEALKLFSENGYDAVSVGEIAKAVGIKAPSLYSHYTGKQAIFDAIVKEVSLQYEKYTDEINIHVQSAEKDKKMFSNITEDVLVDKVRKIFFYSLHDEAISRFRRMMTIEQFRSEKLSAFYTERYVNRMLKYHSAIFENLIALGEIKGENPDALAMMYVSPIITLLGVCDRQPECEKECVKKLDEHVRLFYRTFNTKKY